MGTLFVVIPAYNESETITKVVFDWHAIVEQYGCNSKLVVVDDGSKDNTFSILKSLEKEYPRLIPVTKANSGHGQTLLFAYDYALSNGADYIFQTDSDGQTLASEFEEFWNSKDNFDAIIGHRRNRQDGAFRVFVTNVLKLILQLIYGVTVVDANTPYRLMSKEILQKYLYRIPKDYNLTNVLLSVMFIKNKERVRFIPISFMPRQGGVNSIDPIKNTKIGVKAISDFISLRGKIENPV